MKRIISVSILSLILQCAFGQKENVILVKSPNNKVEVRISLTNKKVSYTLQKNGNPVFSDSPLGLIINSMNICEAVAFAGQVSEKMITEKYALYGNHSEAVNDCKEISIPLKSHGITYHLLAKAYDDGVAFRYVIRGGGKKNIEGDNTAFSLPSSAECYWAYYSDSNENLHNCSSFAEIPEDKALLAPITVKSGNFYLSFSEADCRDFPDLSWIRTGNLLQANFTTTPKGWEVNSTLTD